MSTLGKYWKLSKISKKLEMKQSHMNLILKNISKDIV